MFFKYFMCLSVVVGSAISVPVLAQTKTKKSKSTLELRRTALTAVQFKQLDQTMRLVHLSYAMNLLTVLEATQGHDGYLVQTGQKAKSAWHKDWIHFKPFNEAHAAIPLILIGAGVAVRAALPRALPYMSRMLATTRTQTGAIARAAPKQGEYLARSRGAMKASAKSSAGRTIEGEYTIWRGANATNAGTRASLNSQAIMRGATVAGVGSLFLTGGADNNQASASIPAAYERKKGAFCIFGGYAYKYEARGGGRLVCPAPPQAYNCPSQDEPLFACNTFGAESPIIKSAGCVPLYSLDDLSIRCTESITKALTDTLQNQKNAEGIALSEQDIAELLESLRTAIDVYEKQHGDFENYCGADNANTANDGRQAGECGAIRKLIEEYAKAKEELSGQTTRGRGAASKKTSGRGSRTAQ